MNENHFFSRYTVLFLKHNKLNYRIEIELLDGCVVLRDIEVK